MTSRPSPADLFRERRQAAWPALSPGQRYSYRRTFTDGDVAQFCGVTGDLNPFHLDEVFCQGTPFGRRIVPGLLPGSMLTHIGGLLGFLAADMHFEFLAPVYIGDTVTCVVTVREKDEARRRVQCDAEMRSESGEVVLRASFSGFPTQPRLRPDPPGNSPDPSSP